MSKTIVFLADCLITQSAGIHHYAKQFIRRCVEDYAQHDYYCVLPKPYGELNIQEVIVPIKKLPFHYRYRSLRSIPKKVNALNPDLVIEMAHFGPFNIDPSSKTCTVVHDLTPITNPEWHDSLSHQWHKRYLGKTLEKSHFVITNSESTKTEISNSLGVNEEKIVVCYPQVEMPSGNQVMDNRFGHYILSVGTIEPRKNYINLLRAFDLVAEKDNNIQLVIAGKRGWKYKEVFQYLQKSPNKKRIHLTGYITEEEKRSLYVHAQAFVFASHQEGFGIPLLEAMGHSLPIICSDISITHEVCGNAAIYFNPNDPENISSLIQHILNSETAKGKMASESFNRYNALQGHPLNVDRIMDSL